MSAFMVSRRHIDYLVTAAVARELTTNPDETGRMLWRECLASLAYRYPDDGDGGRPGPVSFRDGDVETYTWTAATTPTPAALHSLIRCYCYQSCEHPQWEESQACFLMEVLDGPVQHEEIETEWWGPPPEADAAEPTA